MKMLHFIVFLFIVGPIFASTLLNRLHIMMTTMLGLTLFTLIALFIVLKRLRPLSHQSTSDEIKDANNNLNNSSSMEDDSDEPALPLSSKNCYVTLVQHDDEQNDYIVNKNSKFNSLTKRLSNSLTTNLDSQIRSSSNNTYRYDTSSTNVLYVSDEQNRPLKT
ncbi:unnamed protein product [Rotaria sp. Silwood1]|nr:unnamed protein product [Rotaria sp. Silwood1]CAF4872697.1 unnamed protein product [Rotaria sp. Silwood1]CAF5122418.1 unnamed protein product [Rotaria sp. Silwood1]